MICCMVCFKPFTGEYNNLYENGLFHCVCCGAPLFSSKQKFDSGSGWPSFWLAHGERLDNHCSVDQTNTTCSTSEGERNPSVKKVVDQSHGMVRTEVLCSKVMSV
jgi:peptide-methionine (R)-S-oxide reductase